MAKDPGPDFNAVAEADFIAAIKADDAPAVAGFLRKGRDPAQVLKPDWHTSLSLAVYHRARQVFDILIDDDRVLASLNDGIAQCQLYTALHFAVDAGDLYMTKRLIERGAHVNAPSADGHTPLCAAASNGDLAVLRYLIAQGADVNKVFKASGETPLIMAAGRGRVEIVQELLAVGADPGIAEADGNTAVHCVAETYRTAANLGIVEALFRAGCDINSKNKDGWSPYDLAEWNQNSAMMSKIEALLAEKGQKPQVGDKNLDMWSGWGWFS